MAENENVVISRKTSVFSTLKHIASGRMVVTCDDHNGYLETYDGKECWDRPGQRMMVAGVKTLQRAGFLSEFCTVTEAGRAFINKNEN